MKKMMLSIVIFLISIVNFGVVNAEELGSVYWDSEKKEMINTVPNSTIAGGRFGAEEDTFYSQGYVVNFTLEYNHDFYLDLVYNYEKSTVVTNIILFKFTGAYETITSFSNNRLYVFGTQYDLDFSTLKTIKLHVEYNSSTSTLTYDFPDLKIFGTKENSGLLKGFELGDTSRRTYYNSFNFVFGAYKPPVAKPSQKIYVPDLNYACYTVVGEGVIRAYEEIPKQDSTINYRDYYINSDYIFSDSYQRFYTNSVLPSCLDVSILTNSPYYRLDFYKILIILFIMSFFIVYVPLRIFVRLGKRFN